MHFQQLLNSCDRTVVLPPQAGKDSSLDTNPLFPIPHSLRIQRKAARACRRPDEILSHQLLFFAVIARIFKWGTDNRSYCITGIAITADTQFRQIPSGARPYIFPRNCLSSPSKYLKNEGPNMVDAFSTYVSMLWTKYGA